MSAAAGLPVWVIRRNDTQAAKEVRDAVPVRSRFDSAELTQFFLVFYSRHGDDVGRHWWLTEILRLGLVKLV